MFCLSSVVPTNALIRSKSDGDPGASPPNYALSIMNYALLIAPVVKGGHDFVVGGEDIVAFEDAEDGEAEDFYIEGKALVIGVPYVVLKLFFP